MFENLCLVLGVLVWIRRRRGGWRETGSWVQIYIHRKLVKGLYEKRRKKIGEKLVGPYSCVLLTPWFIWMILKQNEIFKTHIQKKENMGLKMKVQDAAIAFIWT